jgi:hypothetical protein
MIAIWAVSTTQTDHGCQQSFFIKCVDRRDRHGTRASSPPRNPHCGWVMCGRPADPTRQAVDEYLRANGLMPGQCLFPGTSALIGR